MDSMFLLHVVIPVIGNHDIAPDVPRVGLFAVATGDIELVAGDAEIVHRFGGNCDSLGIGAVREIGAELQMGKKAFGMAMGQAGGSEGQEGEDIGEEKHCGCLIERGSNYFEKTEGTRNTKEKIL